MGVESLVRLAEKAGVEVSALTLVTLTTPREMRRKERSWYRGGAEVTMSSFDVDMANKHNRIYILQYVWGEMGPEDGDGGHITRVTTSIFEAERWWDEFYEDLKRQ